MRSDISVIMTVKNGSLFVKRSIESILNQTFLPREIVIVDDGSSDETCTLIDSIALRSNTLIKLIRTSGIGRSKALGLAVEKCSYEWIANLDVDDYWLPNKLELQAEVVSKVPEANIVTTQSHILYEGEKDSFIKNQLSNIPLVYKRLDKIAFYAKNPVNHSSVLFRKSLYESVGGYNNSLKKQIDYDLWAKFILNSEVFYQIETPLTVKYLHRMQNFEAKNILSYRINSFVVKVSLLMKLKAPWRFYVKAIVFFFIGFTPKRLKKTLRKTYK